MKNLKLLVALLTSATALHGSSLTKTLRSVLPVYHRQMATVAAKKPYKVIAPAKLLQEIEFIHAFWRYRSIFLVNSAMSIKSLLHIANGEYAEAERNYPWHHDRASLTTGLLKSGFAAESLLDCHVGTVGYSRFWSRSETDEVFNNLKAAIKPVVFKADVALVKKNALESAYQSARQEFLYKENSVNLLACYKALKAYETFKKQEGFWK